MAGNKSIKITTPKQFALLAKGYHKSLHKINIKGEWNQIAEDININGPPFRTGEGWMKVWADLKCKLKKKLAFNRAESHATGGETFKQFVLTPVEEAVASLLELRSIVSPKGPSHGLKRARSNSTGPVPTGRESTVTETGIETTGLETTATGKHPEPIVTAETSFDAIEDLSASPSASKKVRKNKAQEKMSLLEQQVKIQRELSMDLKNKLSEIERYSRKIYEVKKEKLKLYKSELERKNKHRRALLEIRTAELEVKINKVEIEKLKIGV